MSSVSVALGLEQRVVLLAGVEGSAGETIAQAFAGSGAWVVVHSCQDLEGTKRIVDRIRSNGGRAMPAIGVTDDAASAWALIERIVAEWAQLDVLVCDMAGLATKGDSAIVADSSAPPAVQYLTTEAITRMRAAGGGRIIVLLPPAAAQQTAPGASPEQSAAWMQRLAAAASADQVPVNAVQRTGHVAAADLARVLLFLGSAWSTAVSGSCLRLYGRSAAEPPRSPSLSLGDGEEAGG